MIEAGAQGRDPQHDVDDEGAMVRRIAGGDRSAFEWLMRRYNRRLYRLARATLRSDADAEDALQEAYLAAYRAIGTFRGESALATWLSRLVLNECFGRIRRDARRENVIPMAGSHREVDIETMPDSDDVSPESLLVRAEIRTLLERRLDALPADFRIAFVLRSVEEMSVEETAACLGIAEATVRSRHFRARSLLRESLAADLDLAERDLFGFAGARCDRIVRTVLSRLGGEPTSGIR